MVEYDLTYSALYFMITLLSVIYTRRRVHQVNDRMTVILFLLGFYVYSGIGGARIGVQKNYVFYYLLFIIIYLSTYIYFYKKYNVFNSRYGYKKDTLSIAYFSEGYWGLIILFYYMINLFPFFYPINQVSKLYTLTGPDLTSLFSERFYTTSTDILSKIVDYFDILLLPFFYVGIYRYKEKVFKLGLSILGLIYLQYSLNGYIGRGQLMMGLATFVLAVYTHKQGYRKFILISGVLVLPFIFQALYWYSLSRIGNTEQYGDLSNGLYNIFVQETSFPIMVVQKIFDNNYHADIGSYFKWIITLPIPKILTGVIDGARINLEISEDILNRYRTSPGFYIMLPGLLGESIYIYGKILFILHSIFIGWAMSLTIHLFSKYKEFNILLIYSVITFAYILNRGGLASTLPILVNQYMLIYIYIYYKTRKPIKVMETSFS